MKIAPLFLAFCALVFGSASEAQDSGGSAPVPQSAKILAIGRFNARPTPEQLQILSLRWYSTGKIDQWFSPRDGNGVVLILNLSSVREADALLTEPGGQQPLLTFELIPVDALIPLSRLLPKASKPAK